MLFVYWVNLLDFCRISIYLSVVILPFNYNKKHKIQYTHLFYVLNVRYIQTKNHVYIGLGNTDKYITKYYNN